MMMRLICTLLAILYCFFLSNGNLLNAATTKRPSEPSKIKFSVQKTTNKAAYFCNKHLRIQSDLLNFEQNLAILRLRGNIMLQTDFIEVFADNLTVYNQTNGFSVASNSTFEKPMGIIIYEQPLNIATKIPCQAGIVTRTANPVYQGNTNIFKWVKDLANDKLELRGNAFFEDTKLNIQLNGNKINIDIKEVGRLSKIKITDNFKMVQSNREISADQALVNFDEKKIIVLGRVAIAIKNQALIQADRLEVGFGDAKYLAADKVQSDVLFIR